MLWQFVLFIVLLITKSKRNSLLKSLKLAGLIIPQARIATQVLSQAGVSM